MSGTSSVSGFRPPEWPFDDDPATGAGTPGRTPTPAPGAAPAPPAPRPTAPSPRPGFGAPMPAPEAGPIPAPAAAPPGPAPITWTPAPPIPVSEGWRGEWNRAVLRNLDKIERIDLASEAEKELRQLFAKRLRAAAGEEVPPEIIDLAAAQLATAVRQSPLTFGLMDGVGGALEDYLVDVGRFLAKKVMFFKVEDFIRADVAARGLNPGEDRVINEGYIIPLERELVADAERIKMKPYFRPNVRFDFKELFREPERFVRTVSVDGGLKFSAGDFKTTVGARVDVLDPLAKDASVRIMGYAELRKGTFEARVEGTARVNGIWEDPRLGPVADLSVSLRYSDPTLPLSAHLNGNVRVPVRRGTNLEWEVAGGLDWRLRDNVTFGASGFASGGPGRDTDAGVLFGLKVDW